jgi:hypothetical protein
MRIRAHDNPIHPVETKSHEFDHPDIRQNTHTPERLLLKLRPPDAPLSTPGFMANEWAQITLCDGISAGKHTRQMQNCFLKIGCEVQQPHDL